jgi:TonB-dependent receptor
VSPGYPAALAGLAIAIGSPAQAQQAPTEEMDEIIVSGIRASMRDSLSVKRDSIQVIDAISAEDVGDFPDKNIGEAIQRVPGVQINRQDGEGRGVSIRGADPSLIRVELNGVTALSLTVGGGRDVDFRDLPVEFLSRVEVVKTPTAEMTEGGIGTVRVFTRKPLDSEESYLAGSVQGVYSDLADEYDPKVALIGSKTFMDGTLGVLLSGQFEQRHIDSNNARTTGWLRRAPAASGTGATPGRGTDVNGDGTLDWVPEIPRYIIDRRETTRTAFNGVVQWKPSEDFEIYLDSTYSRGREKVSSMLMQLGAGGGLIDYANSTVGADNTVDHIELTSDSNFPMDLAFRNINGALEREQYNAILGSSLTRGQWKFDGRISYARGEVQNDEKNSTATIFGVPRAIIDYTGSEGAPNFSFPGIDTTDGALVNNLAAVFNPRNNDQQEEGAQFNVEFKPEVDWLSSVKAGVEHRDLSADSLLFARTIQISSRTPTPGSTGATTTVAVPQATIANIVNGNSGVNAVPFFDTGDLGFPGGIKYWNDNGNDTYEATIAASGLTMDHGAVNPNADTAGTYQNLLDTWSVEEKTLAGYLQAAFKFDNSLVPISALVGVRYFDTNTVSSGFTRLKVTGQPAVFPPAVREGGYNDWLPSINMRFDFSDKLVGRLTAGDVMARPNPSQLAFRRSLDAAVNRTGSQGNPDLLPYEARQYDVGLEYYISDLSYLSVGYFRNEISRFIINRTFQEDVAQDGGPFFTITQPVNGTDQVTINGIEIGGQLAFDFLPGAWKNFGIVANATFSDDKGFKGTNLLTGEILPFPGVSETSYNASIYYETDKFSVRTAYNWRESWLITPSGRGLLPEFNDDYGTLDASASWNVNKNFTAFLDVVNLLDEQKIEFNNPFRRIGNETFGKRVFMGVRAKF